MSKIDISNFAQRNLWRSPSGELVVRPGLRNEFDAPAGTRFVAGASVQSPITGDMWFYMVTQDTSSEAKVKIRVYDENWVLLEVYDTGSTERPEKVCFSRLYLFLVISSPSFETVRGFVGSGLTRMVKVASTNPYTVAIDPPRGLSVAWVNSRFVYANGPSVYFTDAIAVDGGDPGTIVGQGQVTIDGVINGLHVGPGGALYCCTDSGVYALPADAAVAGQVPFGDWRRVSGYRCLRPGTTEECLGNIYGLTVNGLTLVDEIGNREVPLTDPDVSVEDWPLMALGDLRALCTVSRTEHGPTVFAKDHGVHLTDVARHMRTWWSTSDTDLADDFVAAMTHRDGTLLLVKSDKVLRVCGNEDTGEALAAGTQVHGLLIGRVPTQVEQSPVVRRVDVGSDGLEYVCTLRYEAKTANGAQPAPVVGTGLWSASDAVSRGMRGKRFHFAQRTDDLSLVVGAKGQGTRIEDRVYLETRGPGKNRPE